MEKVRRLDGELRHLRVSGDGARVTFLRALEPPGQGWALWAYEVASGAERLVADPSGALDPAGEVGAAGMTDRGAVTDPDPMGGPGLTGYGIDPHARTAAFTAGGRLYRADLTSAALTALPAAGPVTDPRPDPTGGRIGYLTGGDLRVIDESGADTLLAGEPDPAYGGHPHVVWGLAEPAAARCFGRRRGWWWAPDGQAVLAARVDHSRPRPDVSLHLLELDGSWVDVHWDRETYPYLVSVCWCDHRDPLIAVLRQPQQHGLVLAVDARTGETQVHAELADPRWVEPIAGTPCHLPDGRVLVGGELAHDGYDARCLFADGTLLTPPWLYVRRVVGPAAGGPDLLVEGSAGEPSEQHLFQLDTATGVAGVDAHRLTTGSGWHRGVVGGDTLVIGSESLDHAGLRWTVWRGGAVVGELGAEGGDGARETAGGGSREAVNPAGSSPSPPPNGPRPALERVTDRKLPTGVLYPGWHVSGRKLPVLLAPGGLVQGVRAVHEEWRPRQWWADAGFAVVVVDHRGTPGVAPSFEKVVHRRLADLALADVADALAALAGKHPDLDLARVAVHGQGVGGWLAALAVLSRPDLFRCAVAQSPVVDWVDDEPPLAERYLGQYDDHPDIFHHHSLLAAATAPLGADPARPLLLLPDPTGDPADPQNRAGRLALALATAGRPCTVLPPATSEAEVRRAAVSFLHHHLTD